MGTLWRRGWLKPVAVLLMLSMGLLSIPKVEAAFIPSEKIFSDERQQDLTQIRQIIEQKQIGERLKALGYSQGEIEARLTQLSDAQIHELATQMDSLVTGGNLGAVIGVLVIILLVIVILKLVGKQIVIK